MGCCCAIDCSNRTDKKKFDAAGRKISFHRFPKDNAIRLQWIEATRRSDWAPNEITVICSVHFTEACFDRTMPLTRLHPWAVPTIFPGFLTYSPKKKKVPKPASQKTLLTIVQEATPSTSHLTEATNTPKNSDESLNQQSNHGEDLVKFLSFKELLSRSISFSPEKKLRYESPIVTTIRKESELKFTGYKNKIKMLQQTNRRQTRKIEMMKNVLQRLKSQNLLNQKNISGSSKEISSAKHKNTYNNIEEILVNNCRQCLKHRKESCMSCFSPEPFTIVAIDISEYKDRKFLVLQDCFSKFIEVAKLSTLQPGEMIEKLKEMFARHGIPLVLRCDKGKPFNCLEFRKFAQNYKFEHTSGSILREAERAGKTVKSIMEKEDEYLGLLAYNNTALEHGHSPAQLLMGRSLKGLQIQSDNQR